MRSKVLFVVEGKIDEVRILSNPRHGLLKLLDFDYEIVSFCNPIYELYQNYKNGMYDDLVSYLRHEKGLKIDDKLLSSEAFSAVYLIFDFDPHYQKYSDEEIKDILNIFNDETGLGKIYINYPMVESFYHIKEFDDINYLDSKVDLLKYSGRDYKKLVNQETYVKKNRVTDYDLISIVKLNYLKAKKIVRDEDINYFKILEMQIEMKNSFHEIYVLCTMPLLLYDYNPNLVLSQFNY